MKKSIQDILAWVVNLMIVILELILVIIWLIGRAVKTLIRKEGI